MNIGIIGTGEVGSALGRLWAAKGHAVMFGSRDPQSPKVRALLGAIGAARAGSAREAAQFGTVVVLATPFHATEAAITAAGDLSGKIVLDATNPLNADASGLTSCWQRPSARTSPHRPHLSPSPHHQTPAELEDRLHSV